MFKKILIGLVISIGLVCAYAAFQPAEYSISREIVVQAPAEKIFPYINGAKKMNEWMPWFEGDPQVKLSYSGPDQGLGSTNSWESVGEMGVGKAAIIESIPNQSVKSEITYFEPVAMSHITELKLSPAENGTTVRWLVTGRNSFVQRLFCLFMDMDKVVGEEFEKGLRKLKTLTEK